VLRSHLTQIVHELLSQKNPSKKRAGRVAQGVGPEFKTQYRKKKKRVKQACHSATLALTSPPSNYLFTWLTPQQREWCLVQLCNQAQPAPGTSQAPNNRFGKESSPSFH
jgi:hypothetical protein